MQYQAVILDWDGVVTASNDVKTQAFIDIFAALGEEAAGIITQYQRQNGGVSRFEKYRHYVSLFFKRNLSEHELRQFDRQYAALIFQKLLKTPFIPGCLNTLKKLKKLNIPAFVVTGSPADEIRTLAGRRRIRHYFADILGSPQTKENHIRNLMRKYAFDSEKVIFYGDALTDYRAAQANHINFVGVVPFGMASPFPENVKTTNIIDFA